MARGKKKIRRDSGTDGFAVWRVPKGKTITIGKKKYRPGAFLPKSYAIKQGVAPSETWKARRIGGRFADVLPEPKPLEDFTWKGGTIDQAGDMKGSVASALRKSNIFRTDFGEKPRKIDIYMAAKDSKGRPVKRKISIFATKGKNIDSYIISTVVRRMFYDKGFRPEYSAKMIKKPWSETAAGTKFLRAKAGAKKKIRKGYLSKSDWSKLEQLSGVTLRIKVHGAEE